MAEIKFEITERIGVIGRNEKTGWTKEVNLVSWNDNPSKIDIRDWDKDHLKVSKGITLSATEAAILLEVLSSSRYSGTI